MTNTAVKESEILALLINIGAERLTEVDILTRLSVAPAGWNKIFNQVLDECGAQFPQEYISTPVMFRKKADKFSAAWKKYGIGTIHQHIC